jgi:hypothetical protein
VGLLPQGTGHQVTGPLGSMAPSNRVPCPRESRETGHGHPVPARLNFLQFCVFCPQLQPAKARCLRQLQPLVIPESAGQDVALGFVEGLIQSEDAWHIGDLVFLNLQQHIQSSLAPQANQNLVFTCVGPNTSADCSISFF